MLTWPLAWPGVQTKLRKPFAGAHIGNAPEGPLASAMSPLSPELGGTCPQHVRAYSLSNARNRMSIAQDHVER